MSSSSEQAVGRAGVASAPDPSAFVRLAEALPDVVVMTGEGLEITWANQAWASHLGWPPAQLVGTVLTELFHPKDHEAHGAEVCSCTDGPKSYALRLRHASGEYRHYELRCVCIEGEQRGFVGTDISERREQLRVIDDNRHLLTLAEQLTSLGYWRFDLVSGALYWSPGCFRIYGADPETFEPSVTWGMSRVHPDQQAEAEATFNSVVETGETMRTSLRIVQPSNAVREVESTTVAERNAEGQIVAVYGLLHDVTEQRQIHDLLLRNERLASVGTLAAGVAHEINNPLAYVIGNLDLIAEDLQEIADASLREPLLEMLGDVRGGADRVRSIVRGLGVLSRSEAGDINAVDARVAIENAVRVAGNQVRQRARLELDIRPGPLVAADEGQLSQVFVNLMVNAAQAIPEGNPNDNVVKVRCFPGEPGWVVVEVEDTGPGVPEEVAKRIFDPFFTTKPVGEGTGLGLAISHSIIERFGGRIRLVERPPSRLFAASRPAGQLGACFRVELKHWVTTDLPAALPTAPAQALERILVIDDEAGVTRVLERSLEREYDVVVAHTGAEALELFEAGDTFDVILCDLMMPELSGMELYDMMAARRPVLAERFVFITGGAFTQPAQEFLERVHSRVLEKPFAPARVRELVAEVVRG